MEMLSTIEYHPGKSNRIFLFSVPIYIRTYTADSAMFYARNAFQVNVEILFTFEPDESEQDRIKMIVRKIEHLRSFNFHQ